MERKMIGYKCDLFIRDTSSNHEESLEYGASEVGIRYEKKDFEGIKVFRIVQVWQVKQQILKIREMVMSPANNKEQNDSQ
ncbi:hypothetical protein BDF14DRAFT_1779536 [Spinellus fusiger]|nr:hypothetical protein BDF14DRAFT_1779536 [Spinellus fusiger]